MEIAVGFTSPAAGQVVVEIEGSNGTVEYRAEASPNVPLSVRAPAYPGPDGRLRVSLLLPDGTVAVKESWLTARPHRLRAAIVHPAAQGVTPSVDADVLLRVRDLPRLPAGYGPVASLSVPPVALAELDSERATALTSYLAACGSLYLPGVTAAVLERVREAAGCGGRFVRRGPPELDSAGPALPANIELERWLSATEPSATAQLSLLLLPYPLILVGLAASRRVGFWLLLVPPAGVAAYALIIPLSAPPAMSVTWAEMDDGDPSCRAVTLLRTQGSGRDRPALRLRTDAGIVVSGDDAPVEIAIDEGGLAMELPLPTNLLQSRDYRLEGAFPVSAPALTEQETGRFLIRNDGTERLPASWLLWRGGVYPVPALPPNAERIIRVGDPQSRLPVTYLPARHRQRQPALLVPLEWPGPNSLDSRLRSSGWLLVHGRGRGDPV